MKALSIRQPWAWLILHAGKDIENSTWPTAFRGRVLIHASKNMTRAEYAAAVIFVMSISEHFDQDSFRFPKFNSLRAEMGGIVGSVEIVGCVQAARSPWFCGPHGFKLALPQVLPFQPCAGALSFFDPKINQEQVA